MEKKLAKNPVVKNTKITEEVLCGSREGMLSLAMATECLDWGRKGLFGEERIFLSLKAAVAV